MKRFATALLTTILALALVLSGCSGQSASTPAPAPAPPAAGNASTPDAAPAPASPQTVKLAMIAPMTGDSAQYGVQFQRGIETYIEEYNAKGGTQLALTIFDDKNDAKESVNIANKVLAEGDFAGVIGPFSSTCAFAIGEVLDEEKVLTISPSVSHPDYVGNFEYTFRVAHVNTEEGKFAAKYAAQKLNAKKIAAIYSNNDWGLAVSNSFQTVAKEQGMEMVVNESYIPGQTKDFTPIITKIKNADADAVYLMCNYSEAGPIISQMKDMELDTKVFVSTIAYKVETLKLAGSAADDAIFATSFSIDNAEPRIVDFRKLIKQKYDAEIDNMIVRAYDAVKVFTLALDNANGNTDPDVLKSEILKLQDVEGVSGTFSFLPDRNVTRSFFIAKSDGNGSFQFVESPKLN